MKFAKRTKEKWELDKRHPTQDSTHTHTHSSRYEKERGRHCVRCRRCDALQFIKCEIIIITMCVCAGEVSSATQNARMRAWENPIQN